MTPIEWVAIALVTITSASRITRLVTYDAFPPVVWMRDKWDQITKEGVWSLLAHCGYCASFWITLGVVGAGVLSDWHEAWWFINGVFGASYLAAILMANDGED